MFVIGAAHNFDGEIVVSEVKIGKNSHKGHSMTLYNNTKVILFRGC